VIVVAVAAHVAAAGRSANQATAVDQRFTQSVTVGNTGFAPRTANRDDHVIAGDTLLIDANNHLTGTFDQQTQQSYTYSDPFGACYSRTVTAASDEVESVTDGQGCPGSVNRLSWFDAFANYGSSVTGATLQLLP